MAVSGAPRLRHGTRRRRPDRGSTETAAPCPVRGRASAGPRRLLRPALAPDTSSRAGRGPEDPRPGGPASPATDGRVPPPPRRVPRARRRRRRPRPRSQIRPATPAFDGARLLPQRPRAGRPPRVRRGHPFPRPGRSARSRSDLRPSVAGRLRPRHATQAIARGDQQPQHVHPRQSRRGRPLPHARLGLRRGGQPGPGRDRRGANE